MENPIDNLEKEMPIAPEWASQDEPEIGQIPEPSHLTTDKINVIEAELPNGIKLRIASTDLNTPTLMEYSAKYIEYLLTKSNNRDTPNYVP